MSETIQTNGAISTDPFGDPVPPTSTRRMAPGEAAGTRAEHDAYDTDPPLALACVEWLRAHGGLTWPGHAPLILEPTAGGGPFVKGARTVFPSAKIAATDIRPEVQAACLAAGADAFAAGDALTIPPVMIAKADLIVSNPPFKLADQLVRYFWQYMKPDATLAFLLAVTFLGSSDRWDPSTGLFKLAWPIYCPQIVPRPAFTGTSPKFEACLFVWKKAENDHLFVVPNDPIRWVPTKRRKPRKAKDA
jgi:hypothetical protein